MAGRQWAVQAEQLTKSFGAVRAVDRLDLRIPAGSIYGLLGPNGAGKTTVIRMLATLLRPDSGRLRVFGHELPGDAVAVRDRIGMVGQATSVDEDLTGGENLLLLARLLGHRRGARRRATDLLAAFGLADAAGRLVKTYSGGMRRRLDIAAALLVAPDLLVLDEPTTGLDPRSRGEVWQVVRALARDGCTVLLTTQYLEEADRLADVIAVIDHGVVVADGSPAEVKASVGAGTLHVRLARPAQHDEAARIMSACLGSAVETGDDPTVLVARADDPSRAGAVLAELAGRDITLAGFTLGQPSLDDVFLRLTGGTADR